MASVAAQGQPKHFASSAHSVAWVPALLAAFDTLLGRLGIALTSSDTSSSILFDSLQRISAEQVGISANLMAAAKRCGGVMAKMIDAQSVVVGSTATERDGHGSNISRYVFFHSIALTALAGIMVTLQAYGFPFTHLVLQ